MEYAYVVECHEENHASFWGVFRTRAGALASLKEWFSEEVEAGCLEPEHEPKWDDSDHWYPISDLRAFSIQHVKVNP